MNRRGHKSLLFELSLDEILAGYEQYEKVVPYRVQTWMYAYSLELWKKD